jgi:predicted helicase
MLLPFDTYLKSIQKNLQKGSERSHYPALKNLIDDPLHGIDAVIEEKGNKAGIPDFTVKRRELLVGYIEAKDVGIDLKQIEKTEQLQRYLEAFPNLVLTNYLEFRWYVEGKCRQTEVLADLKDGKLQITNADKIAALLDQFLNYYSGEIISKPEDLARQMARLTKAIRLATATALDEEDIKGELHQLKQGFSDVLLPNLTDHNFSDMYAQTISYGLFAARVDHAQNSGGEAFTRRTAGTYIPATNPFLKRLFNTIVETDAVSKIDWAIEDLVLLLSQVDMSNILKDFGLRTRQEDPVFHFYETFLTAYNAALRKKLGVYYTPYPVVSFIVRSIDIILKEKFELFFGLADNTRDPVTNKPRVQILDPATGTGTFLYEVVKQIYRNLDEMGMVNQWDSYVSENLLDRLFGFELLMAPYAIAHLKLGLELRETGYKFKGKQRLGIYLTNTLDEAMQKSEVLFGQFVAQEANEASLIKSDAPVMIVVGNPPYSIKSLNASKRKRKVLKGTKYLSDIKFTGHVWNRIYKTTTKDMVITELTDIGELVERYKGRVRLEGEKNIQALDDDYIKFIRFAHHHVEQTGYGIMAYITNHSYVNGLIHRGMREELLKTFNSIYVLDLHGILKGKSPDGSLDQNVFDIKQGVAIIIAVKNFKEKDETDYLKDTEVFAYDLYGTRNDKYKFLENNDIKSIPWQHLNSHKPRYSFALDNSLKEVETEYNTETFSLIDIFLKSSNGLETGKDEFFIAFFQEELTPVISDFFNPTLSNSELSKKYDITEKNTSDSNEWDFFKIRNRFSKQEIDLEKIIKLYYRPFDFRFIYYDKFLRRMQEDNLSHLLQDNIGLMCMRQVVMAESEYNHFGVTNYIIDNRSFSSNKGRPSLFPLYIYPNTKNKKSKGTQGNLFLEKTSNFHPEFLEVIQKKLGYIPTPEEIFHYIYAIFHSPTYRDRYAEFLKIDFPRVPLTSSKQLFQNLSSQGQVLVDLHLMKSKKLNKLITKMGGKGDNAVTEVIYKLIEKRIYINKDQYFEGIEQEVWGFKIGGYQVLDKWLKDREKAKRSLSFDDILHYQKIVVALKETMEIMQEIDRIIPSFPIE